MDAAAGNHDRSPVPDRGTTPDPSAQARLLRGEILAQVAQYARLRWQPPPFVPGRTLVPYAGRVFDEAEVVELVEASLDFWLTAGRYCTMLERRFAELLGVGRSMLVNSGSSANLLAYSTLTAPELGPRRIERGDEVVTVAAGFPTTVAPIVQHGAVPVFVDVDLSTANVDVEQLAAAVGPRTKAVMLAHTLGNPFPVDRVLEICRARGLWLVEDNCDALGATFAVADADGTVRPRPTGSFGDLSTGSFYPAHHITTGEGGVVSTSDDRLAAIAESIRDWGRDCYCAPGKSNTCGIRFEHQLGTLPFGYDHKYTYSHFGYNLKMTDLQAAVGLRQIDKLPGFVSARRRNFAYLAERLAPLGDRIRLPVATPGAEPSWFGFLMVVEPGAPVDRDGLIAALEGAKVSTRMPFGGNLVRQPCFDELRASGTGYRVVGDLANADRLMRDALWVGVYPGLSEPMLDHMCSVVEGALSQSPAARAGGR